MRSSKQVGGGYPGGQSETSWILRGILADKDIFSCSSLCPWSLFLPVLLVMVPVMVVICSSFWSFPRIFPKQIFTKSPGVPMIVHRSPSVEVVDYTMPPKTSETYWRFYDTTTFCLKFPRFTLRVRGNSMKFPKNSGVFFPGKVLLRESHEGGPLVIQCLGC